MADVCPIDVPKSSTKRNPLSNVLPSLSITFRGLLARCDSPPLPSSDNVRLIAFALADDYNDYRSNISYSMEEDLRRRDRLLRLRQETQEWFSRMREDNRRWRSGSLGSEERLRLFFEQHSSKEDAFAKFVKDNQEKFAQLLEENGMTSLSDPSNRPSSISYEDFPDILRVPVRDFVERSSATDSLDKEGSTNCARAYSRTTSHQSNNTVSSFVSDDSRRNVLSSPTKSAYRLLSTRSTFEYCSQTNTYRFSTQQVAQSFEQGYESISESDDDEDDESVEDNNSTIGSQSDSGCQLAIEYEGRKDRQDVTLHRIVSELLTTERTYVNILHLLDQVFAFRVDQENRAHNMFPQEVVAQMFCNLKSLYQLHHDFFLPQLEDRLCHWDEEKRIGDIMKNFGPFLKMYTDYVKNYDNAVNLINTWYQKQGRFGRLVDEIHRMEECGHLTLQHHMLTPVQRVPRYQLLLKEYLKKLPEDSLDRADTQKALELVSTAAEHANDALKKIDKFKKLLEIQEMLGGAIDLVSPSRELLKEGKIIKISARSGDHQERHLFLFNDLLLLCSQRRIANRVVSGPIFRVRAKLEVEGLVVEEGDNLETANTFYIRHVGRTVELYTPTREEKLTWMEAFAKAAHELARRKSSLKSAKGLDLGKWTPTFIKVEAVSHCMSCGTHFNSFAFKRKHHCHACGIVACSKCLGHKLPLPCEKNKATRICNNCFLALSQSNDETEQSDTVSAGSPVSHRGVLEVFPNEPCVTSGYLQLKARTRLWVKRWFSLHHDFVLYSFRSHEDDKALTSMPVPGYTVGLPDKGEAVDGRENVFKLFHKKKVYYFQAVDSTDLQRWMASLETASRAETPS